MSATGIAVLLLLAALVLAVLGLALHSRKLGVGAAVAFALFLVYVALLGLAISRM